MTCIAVNVMNYCSFRKLFTKSFLSKLNMLIFTTIFTKTQSFSENTIATDIYCSCAIARFDSVFMPVSLYTAFVHCTVNRHVIHAV